MLGVHTNPVCISSADAGEQYVQANHKGYQSFGLISLLQELQRSFNMPVRISEENTKGKVGFS